MAISDKQLKIRMTGGMQAVSALPESALVCALCPGEGGWSRHEKAYFNDVVGPSVVTDRSSKKFAETVFDRWSCGFPFRSSRLELTVDLGKVRTLNPVACKFETPLAIAALKLVSGNKSDLFSAAELFLGQPGWRLHGRSKHDIAQALAIGAPYGIPRRKAIQIADSATAGDVLQAALLNVAARIIDIAPAITEARMADGVHRMRVELRRFRAIERLFRRTIKSARLRRLALEARVLGRALGPARDWDVFLNQTLPAIASNDYAADGFAVLSSRAQQQRAAAWGCAIAKIGGDEFSTFAFNLLEAAHLEPWRKTSDGLERPAVNLAPKLFDRSLKKTAKIFYEYDGAVPAGRHPLRVALKKQRYAIQLFKSLYPKRDRRRYMQTMAGLQDVLGAANDAIVAQALANKAATGGGAAAMRAAGFISGYYAAKADAASKEIDADWIAFEKMAPFWRA